MKQPKSKNRIKGYFTVEAALVIPTVLCVILFLIYLMIFQYDRCLLEQDIGALTLRGSISSQEGDALVEEIKENVQKKYSEKYVAFSWGDISISTGHGKIDLEIAGMVKTPISFSALNQPKAGWGVKAFRSSQRISPVLLIRAIRKIIK